jgi:universal stress protein A
MKEIEHILVLSRMTIHCRLALHHGISLAKKYGATLAIMHVVHNPFGLEGWKLPPIEFGYSTLLKKSKEDIDEAIKAERAEGLTIKEVIREGDPIRTVIDVVIKENIDLLIMLAHEEGYLEHFLFGRANEELVRRMPCSIFLVKKEPAVFSEVE